MKNENEELKSRKTLNEITVIVEEEHITLYEILQKISSILAAALCSCANYTIELEVEKSLYHSKDFVPLRNVYEFPIFIERYRCGTLKIFSDKNRKANSEACLCEEDTEFIHYICERIGRIIHRYRLTAELHETQEKLESKNRQLKNKYIALKELMEHIETERAHKDNEIISYIETIINPILSKMKTSATPEKYFAELERTVGNIASDFNTTLKYNYTKLTPKEREICNYLKNGSGSKEIADLLNLSEQTVAKHRDHIRKKLGISNKKVNLVSFLESLETRNSPKSNF